VREGRHIAYAPAEQLPREIRMQTQNPGFPATILFTAQSSVTGPVEKSHIEDRAVEIKSYDDDIH
jgi:hypothetical protein